MEKVLSKLDKGGTVLIVTHDESSLLAKIFKQKWPAYCLQHPQLYCQESMRNFLDGIGFSVKEISKSVNYFPATYLFKHALWACGLKWTMIPKFNWPIIPLKLGNIITIAVKNG
jgi:hypothetical protein